MVATSSSTNKCLRTYAPRTDPAARLYCFPWAGAGAGAYRVWSDAFGDDIEVLGICLAGREGRHAEPRALRLDDVIDDLAPIIADSSDRPFGFFGHSFGALIAFEVCRRLQAQGNPLPNHLFVSGHSAPHLPHAQEPIHQLDDDALAEELKSFGGAPPAFLTTPSLIKLILPPIRADLTVHETYIYRAEPALPIPITAFGGERDPGLIAKGSTDTTDALDAWREHTERRFRKQRFPGGRFYLLDDAEPLRAAINQELRTSLS